MARTRNIFLIGPMGSGKSTIGRHIAKHLSMEFFDTDEEIETRSGADIAWIFDIEGESGFRKREKDILNELSAEQGIVLATGGGIICDSDNRNFLSARGTVVYLKTSIEQQLQRTQKDRKRPLLKTANVEQTLHELKDIRDDLYAEVADFTFDTDGRSVKAVANDIIDNVCG